MILEEAHLHTSRSKISRQVLRVGYFAGPLCLLALLLFAASSSHGGRLLLHTLVSIATFLLLAYGMSLFVEWLWKISGRLAGVNQPRTTGARPRTKRITGYAAVNRRQRGHSS